MVEEQALESYEWERSKFGTITNQIPIFIIGRILTMVIQRFIKSDSKSVGSITE